MKPETENSFPPLELETRPTVGTAACAYYLRLAPQTLRKNACYGTGAIQARRLPGSSKLHFSVDDIRRLLGVQS